MRQKVSNVTSVISWSQLFLWKMIFASARAGSEVREGEKGEGGGLGVGQLTNSMQGAGKIGMWQFMTIKCKLSSSSSHNLEWNLMLYTEFTCDIS